MDFGFRLDELDVRLASDTILARLNQLPVSQEQMGTFEADSFVHSNFVTHGQFFRYIEEFYSRPNKRSDWRRKYWDTYIEEFSAFLMFPIINVPARDALAYSIWDGGTLPTFREAMWIRIKEPQQLVMPWGRLWQANQRLVARLFGEANEKCCEAIKPSELLEEWLTPFATWGSPIVSYMKDRWYAEDDAFLLAPLMLDRSEMVARIVSTSQRAMPPTGIMVSRFGTAFRVVYPSQSQSSE